MQAAAVFLPVAGGGLISPIRLLRYQTELRRRPPPLTKSPPAFPFPAPAALLRSKGVLWFRERRTLRFTFHLSGRRRVEIAAEGPWEGPPVSHLVIIASDASAVARLRDGFLSEVAATGSRIQPLPFPLPLVLPSPRVTATEGELGRQVEGKTDEVAAMDTAVLVGVAAKVVSELEAAVACINAHERLKLLSCEWWDPAEEEEGGCGVLHFTTRGSVLHGINAEELNAELMRRCNASGLLLLAAVTAPGRISSVTHIQSRDRWGRDG